MNRKVTDKYYLQIVANIIGEELGLHYPSNRLEELLRGLKRTSELFQGKLSTESIIEEILKAKSIPPHLYSQLSTELTINETYFFRESPAICLFKSVLIKEIENRGGNYKIWSAGCSSGEEPYTLAILIKEMLPSFIAQNVKIIATDLSSKALNKANEGSYTEWSFRETPKEIKNRYFTFIDGRWHISQEIKKMVSFSHLNLISENYPSPSKGIENIDLIFCRNVLMYFSLKNMSVVINKLYNSLCEGGWLITSQVELNSDLFSIFTRANICQGFFYKKEKFSPTRERTIKIAPKTNAIPQLITVPRKKIIRKTSTPIIISKHNNLPKKSSIDTAKELANRGDYEKAIEILEEVSNKGTLDIDFFYLYATVLSEKGEIDKAAQYYKKCIYLDPSHILANYMLANIYTELKKREVSMKYYRAALIAAKTIEPTKEISHSGGITAQRIVDLLENILDNR